MGLWGSLNLPVCCDENKYSSIILDDCTDSPEVTQRANCICVKLSLGRRRRVPTQASGVVGDATATTLDRVREEMVN